MTPATLAVVRGALNHDIHRHQKALDQLYGTTKTGENHRKAIFDLQTAVAELDTEDTRIEAVGALVALLVTWTDAGPQGHFTCFEADVLASVLGAYGDSTSAGVFIEVHAAADDDPSSIDSHDRRLLTRSA